MVALDALFIAAPTQMSSDLAEQLGCAFNQGPIGPYLPTDVNQLTTVPGVYAAGDATRFRHSITWASADGVLAGAQVHLSLISLGVPAQV